jgi:hypothetical protein
MRMCIRTRNNLVQLLPHILNLGPDIVDELAAALHLL